MTAVEAVNAIIGSVAGLSPITTQQEAGIIAGAQAIAIAVLADNVGRVADALEVANARAAPPEPASVAVAASPSLEVP